MKKKFLISILICIGALIICFGALFYYTNFQRTSINPINNNFNNPNTDIPIPPSAEQIIFTPPSQKLNQQFAKIKTTNSDSKSDIALANTSMHYIASGLMDRATQCTLDIKSPELKQSLLHVIHWAKLNQNSNSQGQLLSAKGIPNNIFENAEYKGISNAVVSNIDFVSKDSLLKVHPPIPSKIYYYNPNVLNKETFLRFYNEIVKPSTTVSAKDQVVYVLRDIYNPNFGFWLSNYSNENKEFNYGNLTPYNFIISNKNLCYAGVHNNDIVAYNIINSSKVPFILK